MDQREARAGKRPNTVSERDHDRRAKALRENLKRRKQQQRARQLRSTGETGGDDGSQG